MNIEIEKGPTGRIKRLRQVLAGLTQDDVLTTLESYSAETAASYGFADSTDFDLVHEGSRFPPKAVLGLAAARSVGRPLTSDEFSGGKGSPCFRILEDLEFIISQKPSGDSIPLAVQTLEQFQPYSREEIAAIFEPEVKFVRGAGRWGIPGLVETPKDSGNFVFMVTLGKPSDGNPYQDALTLDGYLIWESQTQQNFESKSIRKLLVHDAETRTIQLFLRAKEGIPYTYFGLLDYFSHDPDKERPVHFVWRILNWDRSSSDLDALGIPFRAPLNPAYSPPSVQSDAKHLVRVAPPSLVPKPAERKKVSGTSLKAKNAVDWAERDLRNRELGSDGEKLVLQHEIETLRSAGREDLALQVRHVALYDSAAGYDIASFRTDGSPKRVEVKTTEGPASTPFFISINEVLASREYGESFAIYRVFDHRPGVTQVKFFELSGDAELSCNLHPVNFRAYPIGDDSPSS